MGDIVALLHWTRPYVTASTARQLSCIIVAMVAMTGRVTMVGLACWAGKGGSYCTIQRLFSALIPWGILFWVFFRQHLYSPDAVYLAADNEVVVTKAGKTTYGLDRFFSNDPVVRKQIPIRLTGILTPAVRMVHQPCGGPQTSQCHR